MRGFVDTSWGAGGSGGAGLIPSLDQFHTPSDGTPRPPGTFLPAPAEAGWSSSTGPTPNTRCCIPQPGWPTAASPIYEEAAKLD